MIDRSRIAELKEEVGEDDFAEILDLFFEEIAGRLANLNATDPPERLAENLHALKGSALNIGFAKFADTCLAAEADVLQGTIAPDLVPRLVADFDSSKSAIFGWN